MKSIKLSLSLALIATMAFAEEKTSDVGVSANMSITSNYVWRGMTQSHNSAAVQGGVDLDYKGLYVGVWGSNVDFSDDKNSLEADLYAGYTGELEGIGFDIGAIQYIYPNMSDEYNFAEVYFGLSKEWEKFGLSAKYSVGIETDDLNPDYDNIGTNYSVGLNKSFEKFDLSVAYIDFNHDTDSSADEDNVVATLSFSF
jgi:uncharacterized protein (TIGR02001 family)